MMRILQSVLQLGAISAPARDFPATHLQVLGIGQGHTGTHSIHQVLCAMQLRSLHTRLRCSKKNQQDANLSLMPSFPRAFFGPPTSTTLAVSMGTCVPSHSAW